MIFLTVFSVWIPFLEIGWTIFTFSLAGAKTYTQMLALRFVVGLFEAGYWPALYYILGSWYNKRKSSLQYYLVYLEAC
jgi:ACS family pantothenate transporter-like MFS transporter